MEAQTDDFWARWVLEKRDAGGDPELIEAGLEWLGPVRDRVLANAEIRTGDVFLDVGTGDGLIGFGALRLVGDKGRVIFSDVSKELIDHCRTRAAEAGVLGRCKFIVAAADDLSTLEDESVDVVATRSVLVYVKEKQRALGEFHRVLRSGGRMSIFEPINRFSYPEPEDRFLGYDVGAIAEIAAKVKRVYAQLQGPDDPMLDFDERDLVRQAESAGFPALRMTLELTVQAEPWTAGYSWDAFLRYSGNPRLPTLGAVLDDALTADERRRFAAHLRPRVERGEGVGRVALAYLWARKG